MCCFLCGRHEIGIVTTSRHGVRREGKASFVRYHFIMQYSKAKGRRGTIPIGFIRYVHHVFLLCAITFFVPCDVS